MKLHQTDCVAMHKVKNPYSTDKRELFFFSDPPHLIKTVRNCWSSKTRALWVMHTSVVNLMLKLLSCSAMESIYPGPIYTHCIKMTVVKERVFHLIVPKIKFEHLNLTSFSKMRVDLAAQVSLI